MTPKNDIDFLLECLDKIKDERTCELPSDYIERTRYLPKGISPKPGFFSFDYTIYLKESFNHLSPYSPIQRIIWMKPAQIGYTVGFLQNAVLYHIGSDPKRVQFVTADNQLAEETVKTQINPMIEHAGLEDLIFAQSKPKGSRSTGSTNTMKEYPGGYTRFVGAKNPDSARGRTFERNLYDEIDAWQDDKKEGSKIALFDNRSNAFAMTRKSVYGSTPVITQSSKVYALYLEGDQRNFFVKCPRCGEMIVLFWHGVNDEVGKYGIVFEHDNGKPDYDTVAYKCQECGEHIKNYEKVELLKEGNCEWRPTAEPKVPRTVSYWINALYSPPGMYPWEMLVEDWIKCWDVVNNKVKDMEKYREFRNTKQGLPFEEKGESISYDKAVRHRRRYAKGTIDNMQAIKDTGSPILLVLCSVDCQKNNLFVDIKGYTSKGRVYTIDFFSLKGETENLQSQSWKDLDELICNQIYIANDGKKYKIQFTFIDSGKFTTSVYSFCSNFTYGVYPIKGERTVPGNVNYKMLSKEVLQKANCNAGFRVNITNYKDIIAYRMQRLEWETDKKQPDGYLNFPEDLRDDYFRQFEAEEKTEVTDAKTGKYLYSYWKQIGSRDNHAFDTFVYHLCNLDVFAEITCLQELQLQYVDYDEFWKYAETGVFYEE